MLRDYQIDAENALREAFKNGYKSPCLVAPCGAGKSIIMAEIARKATNKKKHILFLVHRIELCEQIENTFKDWGVDMEYCNISMVQTVSRKLNEIQRPNFIMTDENHHCLARTYRKIYSEFADVPKLGVTATPIRLNGQGLKDINDVLINTVSVEWLINNNFLSPVRYFAPSVADLSGLKKSKGDYSTTDAETLLSTKKVYGDVIRHYTEIAENKQAVCYCSTIKHSKDMANEFQSVGINAVHFDGDTPKMERTQIINKFRNGEIQILCNVDLISEGFDVPDCEVAILLRPTMSLGLYIQQSMRCMRFKQGKTAIILDHVGNYARHGMPTQDREWSLEGKIKNVAEFGEDGKVLVRQCEKCYFTFDGALRVCPNCGYQNELTRTEIQNMKDIRLQEVKQGLKTQREAKVAEFDSADDCKTIGELISFAKKKGYKAGWAYYKAKQLGVI